MEYVVEFIAEDVELLVAHELQAGRSILEHFDDQRKVRALLLAVEVDKFK